MKTFLLLFLFLLTRTGSAQQTPVGPDPAPPKIIPVERTIYYRLGENTIPIKILQYGEVRDIIYINVHDNEFTSVEAAKSLLEVNGGTLVKIENNQERIIRFRLRNKTYAIDPNRIFSRIGIEQTLTYFKNISEDAIIEVEKFGQRLLQLIPEKTSCIIALHNNLDGGYSVQSYLPGNDKQVDARAVYWDRHQDVDDLVFTTDSLLYQKMADQRYNTVWQNNLRATPDGSLSVYCGTRKKRYINIETEVGKLSQHREMLERLNAILQSNYSLPK